MDVHLNGYTRKPAKTTQMIQSWSSPMSQKLSVDDNFRVVTWEIDVLLNSGNPAYNKYMQA